MAYEGPQGGDIRATLALSQAEAQAGSSRTVTLPGGRRLTVPVRAGIRDGEEIRLKGQGEPTWVGGPVGDLVLTVSIAAPSGQYYSQPGFVNESASPTDYMQAPSSLPTPPTPSYPMPNPTPLSNPNYNPAGPYGSSSSPDYPPVGSGGSYPNYPDQVHQQDRPYLSQNHAAYADSPQYMGYPAIQQAGQQYPQQPSPQPPPRRRGLSTTVIILLIVIVVFILAGSGFIYYAGIYRPQQLREQATAAVNAQITGTAQANAQATANALATSVAEANATATAQASAAAATTATATALQAILGQATGGTPVLSDPLTSPSNNNWDQLLASSSAQMGSCAYTGGQYHSVMPQKGFFQPCFAEAPTFGNFAIQVQMTIIQGDEGGIIFRADPANSKFYLFRISQSGAYDLYLYVDNQGTHAKNLLSSSSTLIKQGQNQTNTMTVVARGSNIFFYINGQYLDSVSNNTFGSGKIGVFGESNTNSTDVAFSNVQVWQL
jgi:flagellar basal body-associated protein FliL